MCAVVRLRALMARQAARLITNLPIASSQKLDTQLQGYFDSFDLLA
jgi:hypothetical protein